MKPAIDASRQEVSESRALSVFLTIASFACLSVAVWRFRSTTLVSSDLSMYAPASAAWVLLGIGMVAAAFAMILQPRPITILALALSIFLLYYAPYLMGVLQVNSSDPLTHTVSVSELVNSGRVAERSYAGPHILAASLAVTTTLSAREVVATYPFISKIVFALGMCYLFRQVFLRSRAPLESILLLTTPLIGGIFEVSFYPEVMTFQVAPLVFASLIVLIRSPRLAHSIILFLLAAGALVSHPRAGLVCVVVVLAIIVSQYARGGLKAPLALGATLTASLVLWFLSLGPAGAVLGRLAKVLVTFSLSPNVDQALSVNRVSAIYFSALTFSTFLLIGAIAAFGYVRALRDLRPGLTRRTLNVVVFVGAVAFALPLTVGLQSLSRAVHASLFLIVSPLLAAWVVHYKKRLARLTHGVLILAMAMTILTVYRSPIVLQPSWHVAQAEPSMAGWVVEHEHRDFFSAGLPAQLFLFPAGYDGLSAAGLNASYTRLLYSSYLAYPREKTTDEWLSDASLVVLGARLESLCEDENLARRVVVGNPTAQRPDFCPLFSRDFTQTHSLVYSSGAASAFTYLND